MTAEPTTALAKATKFINGVLWGKEEGGDRHESIFAWMETGTVEECVEKLNALFGENHFTMIDHGINASIACDTDPRRLCAERALDTTA